MDRAIGYALVGAGSFGSFCLKQYQALDAVRPIAVIDANADAARTLADEFKLKTYESLEAALRDPAIEIVHLATPPFTHAELATQCLQAGRHVLCEKPLATDRGDGARLFQLAQEHQRILAVHLVMRYAPLNLVIQQIVQEQLLGKVIAGSVMNLATDYKLAPTHWFWDRAQSGGIFVEHGVHFFDLLESWFGPGQVQAAQQSARPDATKVVEQVRCVVRHGEVLVDHYHGFHQARAMDRQELRIICERGDLLIRGWISESLHIDALLEKSSVERIREIAGSLSVGVGAQSVDESEPKARNTTFHTDGRYRIDVTLPMTKDELYGHCIRELMHDQVKAIHNPNHTRRITEVNGLRSLEVATEARRCAESNQNALPPGPNAS